ELDDLALAMPLYRPIHWLRWRHNSNLHGSFLEERREEPRVHWPPAPSTPAGPLLPGRRPCPEPQLRQAHRGLRPVSTPGTCALPRSDRCCPEAWSRSRFLRPDRAQFETCADRARAGGRPLPLPTVGSRRQILPNPPDRATASAVAASAAHRSTRRLDEGQRI